MTYETPDLLEVGAIREKVLGQAGTASADNGMPVVGSKFVLNILDVD